MRDVYRFAGEAVCHLLMLSLFFCMASIGSVFLMAGGMGRGDFFALAVDLLFVAGVLALLALMALCLGRGREWVLRGGVLSLYFFVLAQLQFQLKTGYFFSAEMVSYAIDVGSGVLRVLGGSLGLLFWLYMLGALFLFLIPVLESKRLVARSKVLHFASAGVFLLLVLGMPYTWGKEWRGASLVYSFMPALGGAGESVAGEYPVGDRDPGKVAVRNRPNILILVLESTRARSVPGFGGGVKAEMPTLVGLMERSRVYERAYTVTPHTSKALVGLLCGVHPNPVAGIVEARGANIPTVCLPEFLGGLGYRSLFIQSATEEFEQRRSLVKNFGFDEFLAREQIDSGFKRSGYFGLDEMAIVEPLREWWRRDEKPMLTVVLTSMAHHPYESLEGAAGTEEENYLSVLNYSDKFLGRLVAVLEKSGKLNNTVVFVVGDHGEAFGEHGRMQHSIVPFEEAVHVPLVVFDGRGLIERGRDRGLRQHIDIFPSVVELIGESEGVMPGLSVFSTQGHERIYINCLWGRSCQSMLAGGEKWIYFPELERVSRFSIFDDPGEQKELPASDQHVNAVVSEILHHQGVLRSFYSPKVCERAQSC
ncbi:Lipoteichoic acid synthase [compost metagenome]